MSGYHLVEIPKGVYGTPSKIKEEFLEFEDAINQGNTIMAIQELSDLLGAIEGYVAHFNLTLDDLKVMKDVTKKVFKEGYRS